MRTSPRNHILEHLVPSQWCYLGSCYGPTEGITHLRVCLESLVQMPVGSLHFMLEVEDEISQLSVPAPQCHITPTIMGSPSGTISFDKLFILPWSQNYITATEKQPIQLLRTLFSVFQNHSYILTQLSPIHFYQKFLMFLKLDQKPSCYLYVLLQLNSKISQDIWIMQDLASESYVSKAQGRKKMDKNNFCNPLISHSRHLFPTHAKEAYLSLLCLLASDIQSDI